MGSIIVSIVAVLCGIIPGFFIVFNSVFSDSSGSIAERLVTFLLVLLSYGLLGLVFGLLGKIRPLMLGVSLSAAAVIILVLYSFKEPSLLGLNLVYICLTVVSSWFGSYLGVRLGKNKNKNQIIIK